MEEIQAIVESMNIQVRHIYREANQFADYLANLAITQEEKVNFTSFNQLPTGAKKIINIDKQQIPTVRLRTRKITTSHNS